MTRYGRMLFTFILVGSSVNAFAGEQGSLPPEPCLGQTQPGKIPVVFAPGIISDAGYRLHGTPAFSPSGDEVFWPIIPPALMHMVLTDSGWTSPETYPLEVRGAGAPVFSRDGARMCFQGAREDGYGSLDIWYLQRTDTGWSAPINLGSPPNTPGMESQPSFAANGDLFYTGTLDSVGMNRGIYVSRFVDGQYTEAVLLPEIINTPGIDYTPYVSASGRFLLFASSRPSSDEAGLKLYVSVFGNGQWELPLNLSATLGLTNSARFPALSPDGNWLFYLSDGMVYWVSADVIDQAIGSTIEKQP